MINIDKINLKKEIEELKKMKGKERGYDYKFLVNYIMQKYGESGFNKVASALKKYKFYLPKIKEVDDLDWLPQYLTNIFLVATVKVFKWNEIDIINMGKSTVPKSPLVKFFIKHFLSVKKTIVKATQIAWRKHYSIGNIELIKYNKTKKEIVLKVEKMYWHPFTCIYHTGALGGVVELIIGRNVEGKKTKCIYKGDKHHEFKFSWK